MQKYAQHLYPSSKCKLKLQQDSISHSPKRLKVKIQAILSSYKVVEQPLTLIYLYCHC